MNNIVITGASSGLGHEIAVKLINFGFKITILDINEPKLTIAKYIKCNVANINDVAQTNTIIEEIDILINCAGINYINWIEETTDEEWNAVIDVNAKSIFNTCKVFLTKLIKTKGTILNIVSNASHMPMTNSIAYNASKGAAHIMTLQMARELGPKGISVFGVSPNKLKETKMSKYIDETVPNLRGWTPEEAEAYQLKNLPAGEETDPKTLAEFILFLLSTKQRHKFLTGCVIPYGA